MRLVRYTYPSFTALGHQRSPWFGLESEIDRLFDTAFNGYSARTASDRVPVDLYEDKDNAYVRAELPGVNRADINVEMVDGSLNITAVRKTPAANGEGEQSHSFSRSISIAEAVQADQVSATYEDGVLTVTLPKQEEAKPKKITVEVK